MWILSKWIPNASFLGAISCQLLLFPPTPSHLKTDSFPFKGRLLTAASLIPKKKEDKSDTPQPPRGKAFGTLKVRGPQIRDQKNWKWDHHVYKKRGLKTRDVFF